jgi:hypothetical protein
VYLSNAEKEALWLTGYGDVPPWAVQQGLEQAQGRGTYVPGEESLWLRLADALALEERLAEQQAEEQPRIEEEAAEAATEGQEAPRDLLVGEGATTAEQVCDFSALTKAELVTFAADQFGVELKRTVPRDKLIIQVQKLVDEAGG